MWQGPESPHIVKIPNQGNSDSLTEFNEEDSRSSRIRIKQVGTKLGIN